MTQAQIAARLGVSQALISRRFTGEVVLDLDELEALADPRLGADLLAIRYLLGEVKQLRAERVRLPRDARTASDHCAGALGVQTARLAEVAEAIARDAGPGRAGPDAEPERDDEEDDRCR